MRPIRLVKLDGVLLPDGINITINKNSDGLFEIHLPTGIETIVYPNKQKTVTGIRGVLTHSSFIKTVITMYNLKQQYIRNRPLSRYIWVMQHA